MVDVAKGKQTAAKANFTRKLTALNGLGDMDTPAAWNRAWDVATAAAELVYEAHDVYVEAVHDDHDIDVREQNGLDKWIKSEVDRMNSAKDFWRNGVTNALRKQRDCERMHYEQLVTKLDTVLQLNDSSGAIVVSALLEDIKTVRDSCDKLNRELITHADDDTKRDAVDWYSSVSDMYYNAVAKVPQPSALDQSTNFGRNEPRRDIMATPDFVRMERIKVPAFDGSNRSYMDWSRRFKGLVIPGRNKTEICQLLWESVPNNYRHILNNLPLDDYDKMFEALDKQFGRQAFTVSAVVDDIDSLTSPKDNKQLIKFVETVERAIIDLESQDALCEISNTTVCRRMERKLPEPYYGEWVKAIAEGEELAGKQRFDKLVKFLRGLKTRAEYMVADACKATRNGSVKTASTSYVQHEDQCRVCHSSVHPPWKCDKFKSMAVSERWKAVRTKGLCILCLGAGHISTDCSVTNAKVCKECAGERRHNIMLHNTQMNTKKGNGNNQSNKSVQNKAAGTPTPSQQDVKESTSKGAMKTTLDSSAVKSGGLAAMDLPCIMMIQYVELADGSQEGIIFDQCSDTSYIKTSLAKRLKLKGEKCMLRLKGIAGLHTEVQTRRYTVKIKTTSGQCKQYLMYGLDEVATITNHVDTDIVAQLFPSVSSDKLKRPHEVTMMISLQTSTSIPAPIEHVGELTLYHGLHGYVVGGAHPKLSEGMQYSAIETATHLGLSTRSAVYKETAHTFHTTSVSNIQQLIQHFCYDEIGVACHPRCGGCRCGGCQPGGKQMSIKEERELTTIENGLTFQPNGDHHTPQSHWDCSYPYSVDTAVLPNNYPAVKAVFLSTEKRLGKNLELKKIYGDQIKEMIGRGAARRLLSEELETWKGPVWYVSHQLALNPHSKSTPARIVWNSSQQYRGVSLNSVLVKGPDVLNPLPSVLLRFREGVCATIGDVKKMFHSVYLNDHEIHMKRFLWRDNPSEEIGVYACLRVNMGDKPAPSIAMLALRKTAEMEKFEKLYSSVESVKKSMYVDDLLDSRDDTIGIAKLHNEVTNILEYGGFKMKHWITSGEEPPKAEATVKLINSIGNNETGALGLGYDSVADTLYVRAGVNFGSKVGKVKVDANIDATDIASTLPTVLTKRILLSQIAGLFDPIGFICPLKMAASILFRETWQRSMNENGKRGLG